MSHIVAVWDPCPPSAVPLGVETPQGISPTGGSEPTSRTQTGAPIAPLPHKTSLLLSYPLPPFPRSSPALTIFPTPPGGYVSTLANFRWRMTMFFPVNGTKRLTLVVSHTMRIPSPSVLMSPQQLTFVASYPSYAGTLLKLGAQN